MVSFQRIGMRIARVFAVPALIVLSMAVPGPRPASAAAPYLTYHGGAVMHGATVYTIFWIPTGRHFESSYKDAAFESGVQQFFQDIAGSPYADIATQYSHDAQGNLVKNGPILNQITVGGSWIDTTPYPHSGTENDPLQVADYHDAVSRALAANHWTPGIDAIFFVYTTENVELCGLTHGVVGTWRGTDCTFGAGDPSCMGHGYFMQGDQPVLFALMPEPVADGCQPNSGPPEDPNNDIRLDAADTLGAFTLFNAMTDPLGTAWYHSPASTGEMSCDDSSERDITYHGHTYNLFGLYSNAQKNCVHVYPSPPLSVTFKAKTVHPHGQEALRVSTAASGHVLVDISYANGSVRSFSGQADGAGQYRIAWRVAKASGRVTVAIRVTTSDGGDVGITRHFQIR
jgi:hypothetical protein